MRGLREFSAGRELISKHIPNFEIRYKNESISSKVIAVLVWVFNRRYMQDYTTTRFPRVYFPSRKFVEEDPYRAYKILMHEFVHLWDRQHRGISFTLGYLFPQWLAVPLFLLATLWALVITDPPGAHWSVAIVGWILALISALPWSARSRAMSELRGYSMNMAINYWNYGNVNHHTIQWIIKQFTGWSYYKMWWWRKDVNSWLMHSLAKIRQELFGPESVGDYHGQPFRLVLDLTKTLQ